MSLATRAAAWVAQKIISRAQADRILAAERAHRIKTGRVVLGVSAGILIGLGLFMIIGANWDGIPDSVKMIIAFAVTGACLFGVYRFWVLRVDLPRELFVILSFLMIGGVIGLTGQVFHLNGGWRSLLFGWAVLGTPLIFFTRLSILPIIWSLFMASRLPWADIFQAVDRWPIYAQMLGGVCAIVFSVGVKFVPKRLPWAASWSKGVSLFGMAVGYLWVIGIGAAFGWRDDIRPHIIVFVFLAGRILSAFHRSDRGAFLRNIITAEGYAVFVFVSRYSGLLAAGTGFVGLGAGILGIIYLTRQVSVFLRKRGDKHDM